MGDMGHATHVLPYLLVARALLAQGRASEVLSTLTFKTVKAYN